MNKNLEIWKPIKGYEDKYLISSLGRIRVLKYRNKKCDYIKKQSKCRKGYLRTSLVDDKGDIKTFRIHRLVAKTFIPEIKGKEQVNHIDGIKTNNSVDNLEWCNNTENQIHAWNNNLIKSKKGIEQKNAKLNDQKVREIRSLRSYDGKGMKLSELSEIYKVSEAKISRIVRYLDWRHI